MEDHIIALRDLESILKIDPYNAQINKNYVDLSAFIENEKKGEKQVFKSFFRKINNIRAYKDSIEPNKENEKLSTDKKLKDVYIKVNQDEKSLGKPEMRILNL